MLVVREGLPASMKRALELLSGADEAIGVALDGGPVYESEVRTFILRRLTSAADIVSERLDTISRRRELTRMTRVGRPSRRRMRGSTIQSKRTKAWAKATEGEDRWHAMTGEDETGLRPGGPCPRKASIP